MNRTKPSASLKKARVLLVDDHAVVRFGVAQLINRQDDTAQPPETYKMVRHL